MGSSGILALSSLDGTNGFRLDGEATNDWSGYSVSAGGDINGDGYDDLIIGAPFHASSIGRSYVVFGGKEVGGNGVLALSSLNGINGFKLDGEIASDQSGISVNTAGNVNGDEYSDLVIGAFCHIYSAPNCGAGRSYVVFGGINVGSSGILPLSSLSGANGFKINGEVSPDQSGWSVNTAGDINGDGYSDLLVGAPVHANYIGRSYVVFGGVGVGSSGVLALSSLNGINGFKIDGETANDKSGYSVSTAGDINGDGYSDLLIGAPNHANYAGRSYVVFGGKGMGSSGLLALSSLNGTNGFKLDGEDRNDDSGYSVSTVGDINGDGNDDLVIGAPYHASNAGRSYVVFGNNGSLQILVNQLTIHSAETVLLTTNNFYATGTDVPVFNIFNNQHGYFELGSNPTQAITIFNQSQILAGQIQFVHDGSQSAPSYVVQATSPTANSTLQAANVTFYRKPTLLTNSLLIHQGESVLITPSFLSLIDEDYPANQVNFSITELQYGQFQLAPLNNSIMQFSEQQLLDSQIFFTQDSSANAPSYQVSVGDPYFALPPASATVTFYRKPVMVNNQLSINQGQSLVMTAALLSITDDYPPAQVNFTISNVQYGQFQLAPSNISVTQFDEQALLSGQVFFIQDNSSSAPSYQVGISDPYFTLAPASATVTFYRQPTVINNQLSINQGQSLLMVSSFLSLANEDYPASQVNFSIMGLQYGKFQLAPLNNSVAQFSEEQLLEGQVFFTQDNSPSVPSYFITVSDPYFTLPSVPANVTFYRQPILIKNQLSINQGQNLLMALSFLSLMNEDYPASQVNFSISNLQNGQFQLAPLNNSIIQFSAQQLSDGQVFFSQDNSSNAPSYLVTVSDPYFTLPPASAAITFYRQPVLIIYPFSICQGQRLVMTSALLDATDDYPADQVVFTVSDLQYADFKLLPDSNITQFTQQQLLAEQVLLVQDGSNNTPSYQLRLSDPYFTLSPVTINTTLSCASPSSSANTSIKIWIIIASSAGAVLLSVLGYLLLRRYQQKKRLPALADAADSEKKSMLSSPLLSVVSESSPLVSSSSPFRQENLSLTPLPSPIPINMLPYSPDSLKSGVPLLPSISLVTMLVRHEQKAMGKSVITEDKALMSEAGEFKISFNVNWEDLKFSKKDKLGTGAYGTVYKGTYKFNEVAIKKLHAEHFSGAALDEFKQEVNIMAKMHSDYIVSLRGVCLESPHFCIVMELMPKGSLYHLLQNSPELPLPVLYRMALDIGYGLYHLHEAGILHRDLKSLNVLLDDRLRAKLTDFGLSKVKSEVETLSSTKSMKGTLGWMAPELFEEKASATQAADIYAYGMILWELMIRPYQPPFKGLAPAAVMSAKFSRGEKQETLPEQCPPKYSELIQWCWQTPEKRPSAKQVSEKLYSFWEESTKKLARSTSARGLPPGALGPSSIGFAEVGPASGVPLGITASMARST